METEYNPNKNHQAISIIKQPDGNWIGEAFVNGGIISVRAGDPNTVVTLLITHD